MDNKVEAETGVRKLLYEIFSNENLDKEVSVNLAMAVIKYYGKCCANDAWNAAINNHNYHISCIATDKEGYLQLEFSNVK